MHITLLCCSLPIIANFMSERGLFGVAAAEIGAALNGKFEKWYDTYRTYIQNKKTQRKFSWDTLPKKILYPQPTTIYWTDKILRILFTVGSVDRSIGQY